MVTQVTISPSFQKKMSKLDELIGDSVQEKLVSLGSYAVSISPVYSGQFVNSWSLRPIGSGAGRSRSSPYLADVAAGTRANESQNKEGEREKARGNIVSDAARFTKEIVEDGGAVLTNRAPHAKDVDEKYMTIRRVKDRFR